MPSDNGQSEWTEVLRATCVATLQPSSRAMSACTRLGIVTVGDFLDHPEEDFRQLSGCGRRTYDDLQRTVQSYLDASSPQGTGGDLTPVHERPLVKLVRNPRAQKAFLKLGLKTVGDFLGTSKDALLAVPGFGERTWQHVMARIQSISVPTRDTVDLDLLPENLLKLPLPNLGLPRETIQGFEDLGCGHIADLLSLPRDSWPTSEGSRGVVRAMLREALGNALDVGLTHMATLTESEALDFATLQGRLIAPLGPRQQRYFRRRIGLEGPAATPSELAHQEGMSIDTADQLEIEVQQQLIQRAPSIMGRLVDEAVAELTAFEGAVTGDHLAQGTLLHTLARGAEDPLLPMRLLTLCFPERFHLHQGCLTDLPLVDFRRFLKVLRVHIQPQNLPLRLAELLEALTAVVDPVPQGLVTFLLKDIWHLTLQIDPRRGEVITWSRNSVSARLRDVFREVGKPVALTDLVFHYRERFRRARRDKIHGYLAEDPAFLRVGQDRWSLREWHLDELELAREEARRIAEEIHGGGSARELHDVLEERAHGRTYWLVLHALKQSPRVRYLGQGRFRPAQMPHSSVMQGILRDFRKAMGELPRSRFLFNTDPEHHRLVARLLRENRAFLLVEVDRIDVLTNYPFNAERMDRLLKLVDDELEHGCGYAMVEDLLEVVNHTDLGGSWLKPIMLEDLLRRHGNYELLPGGLVARPDLELGSWIQARSRQALRSAAVPLTVSEVQAEMPELAEFREVLGDLLEKDPLVQTEDGLRYQVC